MKNYLLLSAALTTVVSCADENDENIVTPTSTTLLTVQVDASFPTSNTDNWVIVHGADGEVLASESFETSSVVKLETEKPVSGDITVTKIMHYVNNGNKTYFVESYANVPMGKTLVLKNNLSTPATITGELNVSVSNVNALHQSSLSCRLGSAFSSLWESNTDIIDFKTSTYTGISKYIVSIDDGSALKYKILEDVKPNDTYTLSFLEMSAFDKPIIFNFPTCDKVALRVDGSEHEPNSKPNRYNLLAHYLLDTHASIQAGYLNSLTNYSTTLRLTYADYGLEYLNVGTIPNANITWPLKSDFSITTPTINNFKAAAKKPFIWRGSSWIYSDNGNVVNWNVYGSSDNHIINELPDEIVGPHPSLSLSNQVYYSTRFYTESTAYSNYVDAIFSGQLETQGVRVSILTTAQ